MLAAPAADVNAEFALQRGQAALESADDARRDARGVPVHSHHGAEGLKPERIGKPAQQFVAAIVMDDGLCHDRAEPSHPFRQPFRDLPAMQRQIGASGSSCHPFESFLSCHAAVHALYYDGRTSAMRLNG